MDYVRLGRTGLTVSRACLGCMTYGTPGWKVHPWAIDREAAQPFFRRAADAGINFFDTADHYSDGASEEILGDAVRAYFRREEVVVATKVGLPMGAGPNMAGLSRKHIIESVNQSLKRLKFDHIDILYTHRFDAGTEIEEMILALDLLVRQGKVHYLGACSTTAWQLAKVREMQKAMGCAQFQVMQNFYNLAYREEEREMIPYCRYEGLALVPWSPIARGFLAGARPKSGEPNSSRAASDRVLQSYFGSDADYRVLDAVQAAAKEHGVTSAQIAYAWIYSKSDVTAPIVGAEQLAHLDQALAAMDIRLDEETVQALEAPYEARAVTGQIVVAGRNPL
jgi:aryl-alcohol dehydrogenase-like predicted oxidoreductase